MAHFAKRHYEAIAEVMQDAHPNTRHPNISHGAETDALRQWTFTVNALSELFASDNPQFALGRFERACEPGANVRKRSAA